MPRDPFSIEQLRPFPGKKGKVKNPDGSHSSERSMSFNHEGKERLVPTLVFDKGPKGQQLTGKQAAKRAIKMGIEKFPSFDTVEEAEKFAGERTKMKGLRNKAALRK